VFTTQVYDSNSGQSDLNPVAMKLFFPAWSKILPICHGVPLLGGCKVDRIPRNLSSKTTGSWKEQTLSV